MKRCDKCKIEKPKSEFWPSRKSGAKDKLHNRCKSCDKAYSRAWKEKNKEKVVENRDKSRLKMFGLSQSQYHQMLEKQSSLCAICDCIDEKRRLAVDHDHKNGIVRGLLCGKCNKALGLMKDDVAILLRAVRYLRGS